MKGICGIYKIESPSGKIYIGSTANLRKRRNEHRGHFQRGDHYNDKLKNAAKKYGSDAMFFSVLVICDRKILREIEQKAIDVYRPEYNIEQTVGKVLHDFWTDDQWRKNNAKRCSDQNKERWKDPEYRRKMAEKATCMSTPEARQKSVENRRKLFESNAPAAQKMRKISGDRFRAMHQDPEFKAAHFKRMSESAKKRLSDPDAVKAFVENTKKANQRPIYCITTGEYFKSRREAAEKKGISPAVLSKQMRGLKTKTGYEWRQIQGEELALFGIAKVRDDKPKYIHRDGAKKKPVVCVELGFAFESVKQADRAFGRPGDGAVSVAVANGTKAFGYSWRLAREDEIGGGFSLYEFGELKHLQKSSKKKPIVCIETSIEYASARDASISLSGGEEGRHAIYDHMRGRRARALGFTWRYSTPDGGQEN